MNESEAKVLGTYQGQERTLPFDLYVWRDDETEHWNIPEKYKTHIEEIFCVKLFDRNRHVHLCELTPSYEYNEVYYDVWCKPNTPDELREEIHEWVMDNADYSEPWGYTHVSEVERLMKEKPELFDHYGDPNQPQTRAHNEDFDQQWECVVEDLNGNPPF